MDKSSSTPIPKETQYSTREAIFIKEGDNFHKVRYDDITYLSSEHVYVTIHTVTKKFLVRASLQEYLGKFDPNRFIRIHQRYAVNIDKVERINSVYLVVNNEEIPVSKSYHQILLRSLDLG